MTNNLTGRFVVTEGVRDSQDHTFFVSATEFGISRRAKTPTPPGKPSNSSAVQKEAVPLRPIRRTAYMGDRRLGREGNPVRQALPLAAAAAGRSAFFPEFMFRTFRPWMASVERFAAISVANNVRVWIRTSSS
ncbi:MAG: hypothetical protein ACRDTU_15075 [Micromonosporaceae bacterium]